MYRLPAPSNRTLLPYNAALENWLPPKNSLNDIKIRPRKITMMIDKIKRSVQEVSLFFAAAPAFVLSGWHAQDW